jgi:hypothetical protein
MSDDGRTDITAPDAPTHEATTPPGWVGSGFAWQVSARMAR